MMGWTEYTYDSYGNLVKEEKYNLDGSIGAWTDYAYAINEEQSIPNN